MGIRRIPAYHVDYTTGLASPTSISCSIKWVQEGVSEKRARNSINIDLTSDCFSQDKCFNNSSKFAKVSEFF